MCTPPNRLVHSVCKVVRGTLSVGGCTPRKDGRHRIGSCCAYDIQTMSFMEYEINQDDTYLQLTHAYSNSNECQTITSQSMEIRTALTRVPHPGPFRTRLTHSVPAVMQLWQGLASSQRTFRFLHPSQRGLVCLEPRERGMHASERATHREQGRWLSHCCKLFVDKLDV